MPPLVIGLTGSFGSGCSTVTEILQHEFGFARVSMSSPIRDEWSRLHEGADRSTAPRQELQQLGNEGRRVGGPDHWAKKVIEGISEGAERVVIDSIRNWSEVQCLRETYPNFFLVAMLCDREERWKRVRPSYMELGLSEDNFVSDDERDQIEEAEHGQQVSLCVDDADVVLNNQAHEETVAAIYSALKEPLALYVGILTGDDPVAPTTDEIAMTMAYTQSRRSFCLKRHVGVVITDARGDVVATGFNENPNTMSPCYVEFRYCFKDLKMTEELRGRKCPECTQVLPELHDPFRCPNCGCNLKLEYFPDRGMRWCTALHAEERALLNAQGADLRDGVLFTTTFPCFNCARQIAQAGIKKVVYVEPYPQLDVLPFLERNGVNAQPFQGVKARPFDRLFSKFRAEMERKYTLAGGGKS